MKLRQPRLLTGRHVGQCRTALGRTDCVGLDLAGLHLLDNVDDLIAHVVWIERDRGGMSSHVTHLDRVAVGRGARRPRADLRGPQTVPI